MTEEHLSASQQAATLAPTGSGSLDAGSLIAKAIEAGLPVDSLERLLAMRERLKAEQAAASFASALSRFQASIPAIAKRQTASIQGQRGSFSYRYADLADIQHSIGPRLAECGLSISFDTAEHGESLVVICRVRHIEGHSEEARFPVPIDRGARMNAAQQVGAALTYGRRYALTAALGIVTAEEDTDGHGAPDPQPKRQQPKPQTGSAQPGDLDERPITDAQKRRLESRLREFGLQEHRERIKEWTSRTWGVTSLAHLKRWQYVKLDAKLEDFAERIAIEQEAAA